MFNLVNYFFQFFWQFYNFSKSGSKENSANKMNKIYSSVDQFDNTGVSTELVKLSK